MVVPGIRSYLASQIALLLAALRIAEVRGALTTPAADAERAQLAELADVMEETINVCEPVADALVERWRAATQFEFVGAGPLYGVAMFSAAKVLEASGDPALAQETEEWSHLQYFTAEPDIPTILLSANDFDADRMAEVARAARSISRPLALVSSEDAGEIRQYVDTLLPIRAPCPSATPPWSTASGRAAAAARAQSVGSAYFCNFEGGRSVDWADGASAIYESNRITELKR